MYEVLRGAFWAVESSGEVTAEGGGVRGIDGPDSTRPSLAAGLTVMDLATRQ